MFPFIYSVIKSWQFFWNSSTAYFLILIFTNSGMYTLYWNNLSKIRSLSISDSVLVKLLTLFSSNAFFKIASSNGTIKMHLSKSINTFNASKASTIFDESKRSKSSIIVIIFLFAYFFSLSTDFK